MLENLDVTVMIVAVTKKRFLDVVANCKSSSPWFLPKKLLACLHCLRRTGQTAWCANS